MPLGQGEWDRVEPSSSYGGVHDVSHVFFVNVPCWSLLAIWRSPKKVFVGDYIPNSWVIFEFFGRLLSPVSCAFFQPCVGWLVEDDMMTNCLSWDSLKPPVLRPPLCMASLFFRETCFLLSPSHWCSVSLRICWVSPSRPSKESSGGVKNWNIYEYLMSISWLMFFRLPVDSNALGRVSNDHLWLPWKYLNFWDLNSPPTIWCWSINRWPNGGPEGCQKKENIRTTYPHVSSIILAQHKFYP